MVKQETIFSLALGLLVLVSGCSKTDPVSPSPAKTGALAPTILYKTGQTQDVTVPPVIAPFARSVRISVDPEGSPRMEARVPFDRGRILMNGIPVGSARILFEVLGDNDIIIFSGVDWADIEADVTINPVIVAEFMEPKKPLLNADQICDYQVLLSWPPCGLISEADLIVEANPGSGWAFVDRVTLFNNVDFHFNPTRNQFEIVDSTLGYMAGTDYRFKLLPAFYTAADSFDGLESDPVVVNIQTKGVTCGPVVPDNFNLAGYLYGAMSDDLGKFWETRIVLFKRPGAAPAVPPVTAPDYAWLASDHNDTSYFDFGSLPAGNYWIYAYQNSYGTDNWTTAIKKMRTELLHDQDRWGRVLQLQCDFAGDDTLSGWVSGAINTGAEYYASLMWFNSANDIDVVVGDYWAKTNGYFEILNTPSINQLAAVYGVTPDPTNDYLYLFLISDEDVNHEFNLGDRYLNPEYDIGDINNSMYTGTITLNATWPGGTKRPAKTVK